MTTPYRSAAAAELAAAADRLVSRTGHWTPARWAAASHTGTGSRADDVFALVTRLADACAAVEGRAARPVPRLDTDLVLPDQLRVMIADLVAAGADDPVLMTAADAVRATTAAL